MERVNNIIADCGTLCTFSTTTYICLCMFILFVWEHCFRLYNNPFRPVVGINKVTDLLKTCFNFVGTWIAKISSFLILVDLKEVRKTFYDMFGACTHLLFSWMYILQGYLEWSRQYLGQRNLVYLGSFLLAVGTWYVWHSQNLKILGLVDFL